VNESPSLDGLFTFAPTMGWEFAFEFARGLTTIRANGKLKAILAKYKLNE